MEDMTDWRVKHRPRTPEEFIGNAAVLQTFIGDLKKKCRAYLLSGPYGLGKTTLARMSSHEDFLDVDAFNITEINVADNRGIDTVRELVEMCSVATQAPRIWILDEVHMATNEAQNALLKLLEEGNPMDHFFLCSTDPQKIKSTVASRCGKYPLEFPEPSEIKKCIRRICQAEGTMVSPEVRNKIIEQSEGHIRDAVSLLQSVHSLEEEAALDYLDRVVVGESGSSPQSIELVKALYAAKPNLKKIRQLLKDLKAAGESPEGLRRFVLSWGAGILLRSWSHEAAMIMENFEDMYLDSGSAWHKFILDCYRAAPEPDIPF